MRSLFIVFLLFDIVSVLFGMLLELSVVVPVLFTLPAVLGVVPVLLLIVPLGEVEGVVALFPVVPDGCVMSRTVPSGLRVVDSVCA